MRYANSVGDFGGLTSYDAHFFFLLSFFLLFATSICFLFISLCYMSHNRHIRFIKSPTIQTFAIKVNACCLNPILNIRCTFIVWIWIL